MLINLENVPSFLKNYLKQVEESDHLQALRVSGHRMLELLYTIKEEQQDYRYADGKWSIREVLCHMIDAERIFAYRSLRFARQDKTPLPGWEENDYAPIANAHNRSLKQIADEMRHVRLATIDLFESFSPEMLHHRGTANGHDMSVMTIGFVISGHETHHRKILTERYLNAK